MKNRLVTERPMKVLECSSCENREDFTDTTIPRLLPEEMREVGWEVHGLNNTGMYQNFIVKCPSCQADENRKDKKEKIQELNKGKEMQGYVFFDGTDLGFRTWQEKHAHTIISITPFDNGTVFVLYKVVEVGNG